MLLLSARPLSCPHESRPGQGCQVWLALCLQAPGVAGFAEGICLPQESKSFASFACVKGFQKVPACKAEEDF